MTALRLPATTETLTARDRRRAVAGRVEKRVEPLAAIDGDRTRSLRQELDAVEAVALGDFHGQPLLLSDAQHLACDLAALDEAAQRRLVDALRPSLAARRLLGCDEKV